MTRSLWKATASKPKFPSLKENINVDVAIVGGGITGITSAYLLGRSGKKVAVLEARQIADSTTGNSTGNLYSMIDKRLHHIQSKWNKETAQHVATSRTAAVDLVESLVKEQQIECGFKRVPWYLFSETSNKDETIEKELKAAADYGLQVEELTNLPIPVQVHAALKVENQAQFNPAAFTRGLAEKTSRQNVMIYENSRVTDIEKGDPHVLRTAGGTVTAKKLIMATHTPKGIYALHTEVYPYREYAIAAKLKSGEVADGIFWDTQAEHHHSIRSWKNETGNYAILVGGHHKVGEETNNQEHYRKLEENARRLFDVENVDYRWSAQHYKPADGLPYIGETLEGDVYVATGFSTDGLTYGVLSAMIFDDLINGRENRWAEIYKATRFTPVKSAKNFIKENLDVAAQFKDLLPGQADAEEFREVKAGEGKVVEADNSKLAVYRDESGQVHCVSAVCTHMGCIVDWNNAEKSWDCPCHGSRFEISGEIIEGPALDPLKSKNPKE